MSDIRRHKKLKKKTVDLINRIKSASPLDCIPSDSVTDSGLTCSDLQEKLDKVSGCASILELKEDWKETSSGNFDQVLSVAAANYCRQHLVCPVCADRMQSRRRAIYDTSIRDQVKLCETGKRFAYLVTYTVSDGENLGERLDHLKKSRRSWRLMGQRRSFGRSRGEASKIVAGISTIEIKRGAGSGLWHAHAHELLFTSKELDFTVYDKQARSKLRELYGDNIPKELLASTIKKTVSFNGKSVPVSKLSLEWFRATDGESLSIHCDKLVHVPRTKTIYGNGVIKKKSISGKLRRRLKKMSYEDSIVYQSKEALKYPFKPSELEPVDSITLLSETYNKRMTATYGQFRGLCSDLFNDDTKNDETYVLTWSDESKKYGDPLPGKLRDFDGGELEHNIRSQAGRITGDYRRKRRALLNKRSLYGSSLSSALDAMKAGYRASINQVWSLYRKAESVENGIKNANCDNYSALLALNGIYVPGSADRRFVYQAVFG